MLVRPEQQLQGLWQAKVRRLDVGDRPIGKGFLDLVTTRTSDQRSPALRPNEQQDRCVRRGHGTDSAAHRLALGVVEIVKGSGVEHQAKALTDICLLERRHIALDEIHMDARLAGTVTPTRKGLVDDVDTRHLPAALR